MPFLYVMDDVFETHWFLLLLVLTLFQVPVHMYLFREVINAGLSIIVAGSWLKVSYYREGG